MMMGYDGMVLGMSSLKTETTTVRGDVERPPPSCSVRGCAASLREVF